MISFRNEREVSFGLQFPAGKWWLWGNVPTMLGGFPGSFWGKLQLPRTAQVLRFVHLLLGECCDAVALGLLPLRLRIEQVSQGTETLAVAVAHHPQVFFGLAAAQFGGLH